CQQHNNNPPTF
nr:immunoglobulin light chain junction region [Macaca mulatta]